MHPRHGGQLRPGDLEVPRHGGEPAGDGEHPGGRLAHVAHEQRVEGLAGQVDERVVLVLAELLQAPQVRRDGGPQDLPVHPVAGRQPLVVHAVERLQGVAEQVPARGDPLGREVAQPVVEAVVAQGRGRLGRALQEGVDDAFGHPPEAAGGGVFAEQIPAPGGLGILHDVILPQPGRAWRPGRAPERTSPTV